MKKEENKKCAQPCNTPTELLLKCCIACSCCAKKCIEEIRTQTALACTECADICALALKLLSADSKFNEEIKDLCSKACEKCAEACQEADSDDCHECCKACQECAEACQPRR